MKIKFVEKNKILYGNTDKKIRALSIGVPFVFCEKFKKGFIRYIDLYLKRDTTVPSFINADIYIDKNHKKYAIPIKNIVEDIPLRLEINHKINEKTTFTLKLNTEDNIEDIYLWTNEKGPCIIVVGDKYSEYNFNKNILFSIITPVYKTNIDLLSKTINSVKIQSYTNWELCIVDDGSNDKSLLKFLESIKNKKIKISIYKKNKGIVWATNKSLEMASGDYIGFLDHDDLLDEHALLKVAQIINDHPETDMIYTDEDKIFNNEKFGGQFYKPDWNYNLMLSSMYTCHFSVYRKKIIDELGGLRRGIDGSQDYDLVLRAIERTKNIRHIPEILYHWRITSNSTSMSIMNKPEARINAVRAISDHLKRMKRDAIVTAGPHQGHYDVRYILKSYPKISIIIPFKDNYKLLKNLLETFKITDYKNYEIILVDNRSKKKETLEFLKTINDEKIIKVKYDKGFNFSTLNNHIVNTYVKSKYILFLNNDIEIMHPEWLNRMIQQFVRPEVSVVGAKLLYIDHRIQHAGIFVGINGIAGHSHKFMWDWEPGYFSRPHLVQDITAVTGACMLVKKSDFLSVGGFDKELSKAFNDIDLCLKLRDKGKAIVYTPYACLYHHESVTRGLDSINEPEFLKAISYIENKWNISSFKDPFYNPNLPNNCEGTRWI